MSLDINVKVKYIGHSTFLILTDSNKKIIIDPWLEDNPSTQETIESIGSVDYILITHGKYLIVIKQSVISYAEKKN